MERGRQSCPPPPPRPSPRGPRLPPPGSWPRGQLAAPRRTRHKADQSRWRGGGGTPARASLPLLAASGPLIRTQPTPRPASTALPPPTPHRTKGTAQPAPPPPPARDGPDLPLGGRLRRRPRRGEADIHQGPPTAPLLSAEPVSPPRLPQKFRGPAPGLPRSGRRDPRPPRSSQLGPREDGEEEPPPPPPAAAALPGGRAGL